MTKGTIAFRKWILPIIGGIGILTAIIYVSTSAPKVVKTAPLVEPASVPFKDYIGGAGLTEPSTEDIEVATNIGGVVREIFVKVGDKVKKGDMLFSIDDRIAKAQLAQTEAKLLQAEAELKNATDQMNIISNIKDKRAISQDEYNQKKNALEIAKTKIRISEAELKVAKTNVDLCLIQAPLEGMVMTIGARVGQYAEAGSSSDPLIRMGNLENLHIRVDIDENDAWRFKKGAKAIAFLRGNPDIQVPLSFVRVEPYVRPKRSLTGSSVERVDTRVLQVIYRFDNDEAPVYAGQQMDVYISVDGVLEKATPIISNRGSSVL